MRLGRASRAGKFWDKFELSARCIGHRWRRVLDGLKYKLFHGVIDVGIKDDDAMVEHLSFSHQMSRDDCLSRSEAENTEILDGRGAVAQNTESISPVMTLHKGVILTLVEYYLRERGRGAGQ